MKSLFALLKRRFLPQGKFSSDEYWKKRYQTGGNSGAGSHSHLAEFKANTLNIFIKENFISSVIEFGCGDGSQLRLARYPKYTGYDISTDAVKKCRDLFADDPTKEFFPIQDYDNRKASLAISLDVIFHLIEDDIFDTYMRRLFNASSSYVIIYSSNQDAPIPPIAEHVRHRHFSTWVQREIPTWQLIQKITNPYPYNGDSNTTSFADFYIYKLT